MTIHSKGDAAVVRNGDLTTVLVSPSSPDLGRELRESIAKVNATGIGNPSPELRQLLHDLEAALQEAFRGKPRRRSYLEPQSYQ